MTTDTTIRLAPARVGPADNDWPPETDAVERLDVPAHPEPAGTYQQTHSQTHTIRQRACSMTTGYLFDRQNFEPASEPWAPPTARRTDPVTSYRAASVAARRAPSNRVLALTALAYAGESGLTDFELESATGVAQTSIGVRRGELVRAGLVVDTHETRTAPSGAPATVWRITPAGRDAWLARRSVAPQQAAEAQEERV